MGIAAIAAYASGPGLGNEIFRGIASLGSANALNQVLAGTLGIVILALLFDAAYVLHRTADHLQGDPCLRRHRGPPGHRAARLRGHHPSWRT